MSISFTMDKEDSAFFVFRLHKAEYDMKVRYKAMMMDTFQCCFRISPVISNNLKSKNTTLDVDSSRNTGNTQTTFDLFKLLPNAFMS